MTASRHLGWRVTELAVLRWKPHVWRGREPRGARMGSDNVFAGQPMWHQLIVIGNGYDLECGLRSRFADFYEPRREAVLAVRARGYAGLAEAAEENGLTAWDFILCNGKYSNWCDIEEAVKQWVMPPSEGARFTDNVQRLARRINVAGLSMEKFAFGEEEVFERVLPDWICGLAEGRADQRGERLSEEDLLELLKDELTKLEGAFDEYLSGEALGNAEYERLSDALFARLYVDELPEASARELPEASARELAEGPARELAEGPAREVKTSVLSFNYTNPFEGRAGAGAPDAVVNIHGHLGSEIIFGIDGQGRLDNPYALPFTKTYRIAVAGTQVSDGLFYVSQPVASAGATEMIKFYGHSLGPADYSYFQSIFDGIDLYGGVTKLVFYYRPWMMGGELVPEEQVRTDMVTKVATLLDTYGKTLDNKDHGKNLMHKLMLEGRLKVKRA